MSIHPDFICTGLEDRYNHILSTRMLDLPFLNPELRVQAVGFEPWNDCCVGVLITPWFMNLMLVSCEGSNWDQMSVGDIETHAFPSGKYDFIVGHEEGIGFYQSCSLFSPMFEFTSHEEAVLVAVETMDVLMHEANRDDSDTPRTQEILDIWEGKTAAPPAGDDGLFEPAIAPGSETPLRERLEQPMSRRELLRGSFLSGGDTHE